MPCTEQEIQEEKNTPTNLHALGWRTTSKHCSNFRQYLHDFPTIMQQYERKCYITEMFLMSSVMERSHNMLGHKRRAWMVISNNVNSSIQVNAESTQKNHVSSPTPGHQLEPKNLATDSRQQI